MAPLHALYDRYNRGRRQVIDLGFGWNKKHQSTEVNGNNIKLYPGWNGSGPNANSNGLKTVSTILQDGSDLLGAPFRWIKDMQQNWFAYILVTAILLLCVLFLYCIVRYHCSRRQKNSSDLSRLTELATVMASVKSPSLPLPSIIGKDQA